MASPSVQTSQDRFALRRHVQMIVGGAGDAFAQAQDQRDLNLGHEACLRALREPDAA